MQAFISQGLDDPQRHCRAKGNELMPTHAD